MALARPALGGWIIAAPEPVGELPTFLVRLLAAAGGGAVALGLDAPLGLPRAYAAGLPDPDFPAFLRRIGTDSEFFNVAETIDQVAARRPFYPARGRRGMSRAAHAGALGFPDATGLSRACDRATAERPAGAPPFWTLGANQTGKAAIILWRDVLGPALRAGAPVRLWPFAGPFRSLIAPGVVAIAETYPAEALRHLAVPLHGSKRRRADRAATAPGLRGAMRRLNARPAEALDHMIKDGFGTDAAAEDRFDCLLGVLCVLGVLAGLRSDAAPPDPAIQRWEGWVLGQTALPRELLHLRPILGNSPASQGAPDAPRPRPGRMK